jgi:hypothetical protein
MTPLQSFKSTPNFTSNRWNSSHGSTLISFVLIILASMLMRDSNPSGTPPVRSNQPFNRLKAVWVWVDC